MGAAIAAGSQAENGIWALLVILAKTITLVNMGQEEAADLVATV